MNDPRARLAEVLAGRYTVDRELGAGGMATVYGASDIKHDRQVAIKVLRPELAAVIGADRFLAEIKTTANLQHPHVLPLHDSGTVDGTVFYVMPFVEGESLRDRLNRERQLPIADALRLATEVAGALDYAHRQGVIHRDVKPENILLHDGRALVADFGIALAASRSEGGSRMTETGMSLGTPHYMSPEQAMGERDLDARTDIYALGAMLYEMLIGEPPFTGPTAQGIVAKVMTEKPASLCAQRERVPPHVDEAVRTALEKLPADRHATAADFAAALALATTVTMPARPLPRRVPVGRLVAGGMAIAAVAFLIGRMLGGGQATPIVGMGATTQVTWEPGLEVMPAISPDGRYVAYAAGTSTQMRIFVRQISGGRPIPLTDRAGAVEAHPQWSRDGSRILFLAAGGVFSAPATGGTPRPEIPAGAKPIFAATWSPDETQVAFATADSVFVRGGDDRIRPLAAVAEAALCTWGPLHLIACTSANPYYLTPGIYFGNLAPSPIVAIDARDGSVVTAVGDSVSSNQSPAWSPDGQWLYYLSNRLGPADLYAMRVDDRGGRTGDPVRLTVGLGAQSFSLSADGSRIAYARYIETANIWSLPMPADLPTSFAGATQVTSGQQIIENMSVSWDGAWLYYDSDLAGNADVYRLRLPAGRPERLTTDPSQEFSPSPSPDGRLLAFHSWRTGSRDIFVMPLDGGPLEQVTSSPMQEASPRWSPDGTGLVFQLLQSRGIWTARRDAAGQWLRPVERSAIGAYPTWSADGEMLSFVPRFLGAGLFTVPADSGPLRMLVDSTESAIPKVGASVWSRDGRTVYFKSHDLQGNASVWSVPSSGGQPRLIVNITDPARPSYRPEWTMGPDGTMYFPIQDRQSNVWVIDVVQR